MAEKLKHSLLHLQNLQIIHSLKRGFEILGDEKETAMKMTSFLTALIQLIAVGAVQINK